MNFKYKKFMKKSLFGGVGFFFILVLIHICKITWQTSSLNSKQKEASMEVSKLIQASQSYIEEYKKLPQTTKDLSKYRTIVGCAKDDPEYCNNEPYINHKDDEIKRWFSPSGNYLLEIKPYEGTFFILATPTGKIKQTGYGVKGFSGLAGGTKMIELKSYENNLEFDFKIYKKSEFNFLMNCIYNLQHIKDPVLKSRYEEHCLKDKPTL